MPPVDTTSQAYHFGQIIGVCLVIILPVLFGRFLYMYAWRRERRYLVMTIFTGIPTLLIFTTVILGGISGFHRAAMAQEQRAPLAPSAIQELLDSPWQEVTGEKYKYSIQLPNQQLWSKSSVGDYDMLANYRGIYVGIIPELLDVDLDDYITMIQNNVKKKIQELEIGDAKNLTIDGQEWKSYEMQADIQGVKLHYRNFICSNHGKVVQVLFWCSESRFAICSPVIDRIAASFRFNTF